MGMGLARQVSPLPAPLLHMTTWTTDQPTSNNSWQQHSEWSIQRTSLFRCVINIL